MGNENVFRPVYRTLTEEEKKKIDLLKDHAGYLYDLIDSVPDGREKSIAKTKLEESVMWAVKGLTA